MEYETRTIKKIIVQKGKQIFDESVIEVEIDDEAAGEFIKVRQICDDAKPGELWIDPGEWPHLRALIDEMFETTRSYDEYEPLG